MKKKSLFILIVILILTIIDQIIKYLVVSNISIGSEKIIIDNFLKFIYIRNTGAAFGILSGNIIFLIFITVLLIFYIVNEMKKNINNNLSLLSFSLILSGALGNLIDRVVRGYVVDYISFTLFNREMSVFNLADTYITIGVVLLIYIVIKEGKNERISSSKRR
ncbi:MAG: signal peptidase II [Tenericutes bacterium]|nr:signal peptidase II [Mycoplasmatota bacterium]